MKGPYLVTTTDRAGCSFDVHCKTFADALARVKLSARRYPDDAVTVYNIDKADCDNDGLHWDEWEAVQSAVADE